MWPTRAQALFTERDRHSGEHHSHTLSVTLIAFCALSSNCVVLRRDDSKRNKETQGWQTEWTGCTGCSDRTTHKACTRIAENTFTFLTKARQLHTEG